MDSVTQAYLTLAAHRLGMSIEQAAKLAAELLEMASRADKVVAHIDGVEKVVIQKNQPSDRPCTVEAPGGAP